MSAGSLLMGRGFRGLQGRADRGPQQQAVPYELLVLVSCVSLFPGRNEQKKLEDRC